MKFLLKLNKNPRLYKANISSINLLVSNMTISNVVDRSFHFNILIMKIVGLYPVKIFEKYYKIYAYVFYSLFILPVPVLSIIYLFYDEDATIESVTDTLFLVSQIGILIIKLLPFIQNAKDIQQNIYTLETPSFMNYSKTQEKIIEDCIATSKKKFQVFISFCLATVFAWSIKPFFKPVLKLPVELLLPYNATRGPTLYFPTYIFTVLGVLNAATSNAAIDPLMTSLLYHGTGQVRILKNNLMYMKENVEEKLEKIQAGQNGNYLREVLTYEAVKECVRHYNAILEFVKHFEKMYNFVIFVQFVSSVFVICLTCFKFFLIEPWSSDFYTMILYLATMLLEIYLYCYYGTLLYEESNSIGTSVYMSKWYEFDLKSKKALVILMQRSQRATVVTAGKLFNVSLETFTTIIKKSYSLLTVLQNYY